MANLYVENPAPPQFSKAKFLSHTTLLGWGGVLIVDIFSLIFLSQSNAAGAAIALVFFYVIIGLPIAYAACFLCGLPMLSLLERLTRITHRKAIILGLSLGVIFGSVNAFALIALEVDIWKVALDWLSTILIGGGAAHLAYKKSSEDITVEEYSLFD